MAVLKEIMKRFFPTTSVKAPALPSQKNIRVISVKDADAVKASDPDHIVIYKLGLERHTAVYRCPFIHYVAAASRLKRYAIPFGGVTLSIFYPLYYFNFCEMGSAAIVLVLDTIFGLKFVALSKFLQGWVGSIYVTSRPDGNFGVKISYLDFWGNRVNEDFHENEFVKMQFKTDNRWAWRNKFYVRIRHRESNRIFKVHIRHGDLHSVPLFEEIFGYIPVSST